MGRSSYKLSYYVLYALIAIILIVLALFYFVGFNNPVGEYNAPQHTATLIYLMYGMLAVAVIVTIIGAILQFVASLRDNPKRALRSLIGLILLVVVLLVAYSIGSDKPLMTGNGLYADTFWLKVSDMFLYATYILFGVAALGVLLNLTGMYKSINKIGK